MKRFLLWFVGLAAFYVAVGFYCTSFPGSNVESLGAASDEALIAEERLQKHVEQLSREIGTRRDPASLAAAADYLAKSLTFSGYEVSEFEPASASGRTLVAEMPGRKSSAEVLIVCAHYGTLPRTPGADANASGCAVLLEVAGMLAQASYDRTVRYVLFPEGARADQEPENTVSGRYARACAQKGERIVGVLNIDSVGTFESNAAQRAPLPLRPFTRGKADFVAAVGSFGSRSLVEKTVGLLRTHARMPIEGLVVPSFAPGADFSGHAGFWSQGIPALTLTTTGTYRSSHWGAASDTADRLDYDRMARFAVGLARALSFLGRRSTLT